MRYYSIIISDPVTGKTLIPDPAQAVGFIQVASGAGVVTYTSFVNNQTLANALNIELDIPIYTFDAPSGAAYLKIWGIGLKQIGQSSDLNGKLIQISAGMQKGLPLANPAQSGIIAQGQIFQAFGNWQGINQTLDFVFYAATGTSAAPTNLISNWKAGMSLNASIQSSLSTAFPGYAINININPKLILSNDEPGYYETLGQFATHINTLSKSIIGGAYSGVRMVIKEKIINVFDGTTPTAPKPIVFTDLIGQPTWVDFGTIQIQCVMRADLQVGDYISLPQSQVTTSAQSYSNYRNSFIFNGSFLISSIRQVGNFRQPDAASWITVINATTVAATT